jgi:GNAT superfamily N-acetyltransferase
MNDITYYKAEKRDLQILVDLRVEFLVEFWGEQSMQAIDELKNHLTEYYNQVLNDNSYICYLAKVNNEIVGIGGMIVREQAGNFKNPTGVVGYIMNMYTSPSFRRKGVCARILNLLLADGKEQGIKLFELHATKEGEEVYPKHGFKIHPEPTYRKYVA